MKVIANNAPAPRYVRVTKDHDDIKVVWIGMWSKYGEVESTCNGHTGADSVAHGPHIYITVEDDEDHCDDCDVDSNMIYEFPELVGWRVLVSRYVKEGIFVVFTTGTDE